MSKLFEERNERDSDPFHSPTPTERVSNRRPDIPSWKRTLDWGFILVGAPLWVPLMGVISLYIKLVSRGPVLFYQERVGFGGRNFVCLKFRTMRYGANTHLHDKHVVSLMRSNRPLTKMDQQDHRLIPLGWVLRSTGLDELPQVFNILRGEMSLVGPRPCTPREYSFYAAPQRKRTESIPGLTGLWQVSGKNKTTFAEMIQLDLNYQKNISLWLDLTILVKTPIVLLGQLCESLVKRWSEPTSPPVAAIPTPREVKAQAVHFDSKPGESPMSSHKATTAALED